MNIEYSTEISYNPWTETDETKFIGDVKIYYDNLFSHLKKYKNNIFVETGTYIGNGLNCAIKAGFTKCYSIEIHKYLYDNAAIRFSNEIKDGKIELTFGNSEFWLGDVVDKLSEPATFWLDAHISSQYGEKLAKNCPIMEELAKIKSSKINTHTILIDDLNCFDNTMHDNIKLMEVKTFILSINPNYKFSYLDAAIPHNILGCYV